MTYNAAVFIKAIKKSGGIISTIASRVGCTWNTAQKYIIDHPTVSAAYKDECEVNFDRAEGVLLKNIELAVERQKENKQADSSDAKWYLARKAKDRGYVERQEITGKDGGSVVISWDDTDKD